MESWLELGFGKGKPPCRRAALSCYRDHEHLEEVRRSAPRRKHDFIARIDLRPEHGMLDEDGADTHCSLWLYAQYLAVATQLFKVVG